jgi:hypothetical protein
MTSSGRTRRKSRTQGSVAGSVPRAFTTSVRTSFHSVICIARFARQTHSCNRIGLGPAWKVVKLRMIEARSSGSCSRGTWWRSYTIWQCERRSTRQGENLLCPSVWWRQRVQHWQQHSTPGWPVWSSMPLAMAALSACLVQRSATVCYIPTSGTAPSIGVPALSVPGSLPTAS